MQYTILLQIRPTTSLTDIDDVPTVFDADENVVSCYLVPE